MKAIQLFASAACCLAAVSVSRTSCQAQGTFQISFDGPPILNNLRVSYNEYYEAGIYFRSVPSSNSFHRIASGSNSGGPFNGTAYIQAGRPDLVEFSSTNGTLMNLYAVDLAELFQTVQPQPVTVNFIGYRPDGSTVATNFTTDGIMDQTGPIVDFQTFHFDSQFSNLARVEILKAPWSMDNLVMMSVVPEPSGLSLLALGGLSLTVFRRRRRELGRLGKRKGYYG